MNGPVKLATGRSKGATRKYAVKSLKKSNISSVDLAFTKSEVELYLSLDHPHIARLEQVFEQKDHVDLVMECMEGGELYERLIDAKQFDEKRAAVAIRQILLAVRYLHARGIVHRDLKLENFLYERENSDHLKLIDFGLAARQDGQKKMTQQCGSPNYLAPEVLAASYTEKADLWSVGVISFMLLVGGAPVAGQGDRLHDNIRKGRILYGGAFSRLPKDAQDFVKALLVVDPTKRLSAAEALQHKWLQDCHTHENASLDGDVLQSLQQFAQAPPLQRACLGVTAWCLPLEETVMLREQFLAIDRDGTGTITFSALKRALSLKGQSDEETLQLFSSLDTNGDEEITYSEFLAGALQGRVHLQMDAVRETFNRFDADGSGEITKENFQSVVGKGAGELVRDADTDDNGVVSFEEFFDFLQGVCGMTDAHRLCTSVCAQHNGCGEAGRLEDALEFFQNEYASTMPTSAQCKQEADAPKRAVIPAARSSPARRSNVVADGHTAANRVVTHFARSMAALAGINM
jgi:calcium-dependent protein kinase